MNKNIPTYSLENFSEHSDGMDVFLLNQKVGDLSSSVNIPFRSNYFGVGICISGKAELIANLETYSIEPNWVVAMSPQIIKQWVYMSQDFATLTIFFTKNFITTTNYLNLDNFPFFESIANHAFPLSDAQSQTIIASLNFLQQKYNIESPYRNEMLKNVINIVLYEIAGIYNQQSITTNLLQTRSQLLAADFKRLVNIHFPTERSVKFYAQYRNTAHNKCRRWLNEYSRLYFQQ